MNMFSIFSSSPLQNRLPADLDTQAKQSSRLLTSAAHHRQKIAKNQVKRGLELSKELALTQQSILGAVGTGSAFKMATDYLLDAAQRLVLTLDVLRERGNNDKSHEEAGTPPVLDYAYEVIIDGRDLEQPVNYQLLRILPPAGVLVVQAKRPYMIIDPRAGHGAGIGGFKPDSQVGVAHAVALWAAEAADGAFCPTLPHPTF